ncbi:hypothetical protein DXG03_007113 [Asterophora parasitica]|uniref:BZIP domain-containing protein n=1 Tax=Asterophora parasitica TaxID=117018 RepID=A0A9P7GGA2_9AGAR|nr:hypothetical protein DXG03_007113 [Asterophora parasitica]
MVAPAVATHPTSSSSTLWATGGLAFIFSIAHLCLLSTASKEWVIAPKPKPGRKPKKEVTTPTKSEGDAQLDAKGRRVQNRAAQRAFRERKQSQLAELQARVQQYEQGEIERNVALQNIAKRLKEENEALRAENALLKEKLSKAGPAQAMVPENDKKRWREDSPFSHPVTKRAKPTPPSPRVMASPLDISYAPSPPSMVCSPDSTGTSDDPLPKYDAQHDMGHSSLSTMLDFSPMKSTQLDGNEFPPFDCGFCSDDTPCVCREFVQQATADFKSSSNAYNQTNLPSILHVANTVQLEPLPPRQTCILENLPPYQPPVPLRRRSATSNVKTIFAVAPPPPVRQAPPANCSGDPSNCMACADDSFGKAFCSAIEEVANQPPCTDCPCSKDAPRDQPECANRCGNSSQYDCRPSTSLYPSSLSMSPVDCARAETMPTNDAWRQIKAHPNVAFADLSLLAEVVSRRSKCTGPRVVISPALGSVTPERTLSPNLIAVPDEHKPVLLTDPHAHYREKERGRSSRLSPSPRLVPQDVLIKCGRQRVREVQTDAVRAALRLLDAKFT